MAPLIVGSTLSDLGRNALIADQQAREPGMFNQQMLLNQMVANQQDRQRQQALADERTYRNNLLAQQDRQWNTPNATQMAGYRNSMDIATLPWNRGMTPAQQAEIDVRKQAIQANPYGIGGRNPFLDDAIRHAEKDNAAQREADAAAAQANAMLGGIVNQLALPKLKERLDAGTDNKDGGWFGGLAFKDPERAAAGILGTDLMPDSLSKNDAVVGTQAWWGNADNPVKKKIFQLAANQLVQAHPELSSAVEWNDSENKFVAKSQRTPFMDGRFDPKSTPTTTPSSTPAPTPTQPPPPVAPYTLNPGALDSFNAQFGGGVSPVTWPQPGQSISARNVYDPVTRKFKIVQ